MAEQGMAVNQRRAGAIVSMVYSVAQAIIGLLYVPLLLRGIGSSEYGLYQMVGSIIAYLSIAGTTLSSGITRFYCKYHAEGNAEGMENTLGIAKRLYRIASPLVLLAALVMCVVFRVVYQNSLTTHELNESVLMLAILAVNLLVTMQNTISNAVISAHERFVLMNGILLGSTILQPILVVLLINILPHASAITAVQLLLNVCVWRLQASYAKRRLGMITKLRFFDRELQKNLLLFSSSILLGVVADQIFWKTNQLVIAFFYSTATVAVYAVGSQVFNCYMSLGYAVSSVFLPKISLMYHDRDYEGIDLLFRRVGRLAFYLLFLVLSGFVVFGKDFIQLWAGEGYEDAYFIALIIMAPFTVDVMQNTGLTILKVMNRYKVRAILYVAAAILNIGLSITFVQLLGPIGAAISTGASVFVVSGVIMNWYYARIGLDIKAYWYEIARLALPLIFVMCCAVAIKGLGDLAIHGWGALALFVGAYSAVFAITAYFISMNQYEKNIVNGAFRKLLSAVKKTNRHRA